MRQRLEGREVTFARCLQVVISSQGFTPTDKLQISESRVSLGGGGGAWREATQAWGGRGTQDIKIPRVDDGTHEATATTAAPPCQLKSYNMRT